MADGVDDLLLWGDDFEVILDILEGDEAVEQQFVAAANNVSSNCANFRFEFLATGPKRSLGQKDDKNKLIILRTIVFQLCLISGDLVLFSAVL